MVNVINGQTNVEYCQKLGQYAKTTAEYVENHGVKFIRHEEKNVSTQTTDATDW